MQLRENISSRLFYGCKHLLVLLLFVAGINLTTTAADLDPGFGSGGKVLSSPDGSLAMWGTGMALQSDGKIVMAGSTTPNQGFVVTRYNSNGSLDTDFGVNGFTIVSFGEIAGAGAVAMQADGKIVIGGYIRYPPSPDHNFLDNFAIARLNPDGSLDTTFDTDGKTTVSFYQILGFPFSNDFFRSLKVAPDGKIVVGGFTMESSFFKGRLVLGRFNTDGSLDASFGTGGRVITDQIGWTDEITDMLVQADGSIVVAAESGGPAFNHHIAVKYNSAGGVVWTYKQAFQANGTESLNGVAALPNGKFIFVGKHNDRVFAMRLNADGTADNSFLNAAGTPVGEPSAVALQSDGRLVVSFTTNSHGGINGKFSLIRYNADGALDTTFAPGGFFHTTLLADASHDGQVLIQPDGKILLGGSVARSSPSERYFSLVRFTTSLLAPAKPGFDYDGDLKTDISVFRASIGGWFIQRSAAGYYGVVLGDATDKIGPADYDGDGKTDVAIFRTSNETWYILNSSNGSITTSVFGAGTDTPVPGDFDGDGKADINVFRNSDGTWYRLNSSNGSFVANQFGTSGDKPQSGDFDGDGKADIAVFRPANGAWYWIRSSDSVFAALAWGVATDLPVPADYEGDGKTDVAIYRPSSGSWFILKSSNGALAGQSFGAPTDIPVPGDYDGDGVADVAIFRPSDGNWWMNRTSAGIAVLAFGTNGDKPTPSAFIY